MSTKSPFEATPTTEIDVDAVLERLFPAKLIRIFQQCDNIAAARAAAQYLEKLQDQLAVDRHHETEANLTDPIEVARHYGRLELPKRDLRAALGREPKPAELQAYQKGRRSRVAEMRALELHRAKRGHRIEPWMTRC